MRPSPADRERHTQGAPIGRRDCVRLLLAGSTLPWLPTAAQSARREQTETAVGQLASNHATMLGPAAVTGPFNETARRFSLDRTGPRGRDFSRRMVWSPSRSRALFLGANHGSPHRLNDVWEFDLPSLSWILLYAPDLPRGYGDLGPDSSDVLYRDGVLVTRNGGPAVIGHTWSGLTWDEHRKMVVFMNTWPVNVDAMVRSLGKDPSDRDRSPPLWVFDPASRQWARLPTAAPWPKAAVGALLVYVPELGGCLWHLNNWQLSATWLLRNEPLGWTKLVDAREQLDFRTQAPGRELVGYHDPVREIVVAAQGSRCFHFSTRQRRWQAWDVRDAPDAHDARGTFVRNPRTGGGLYVDFKAGKLWDWDPDRASWTSLAPAGPAMPAGNRTLAFADPKLGVLAVIDDTDVWIYRPPGREGKTR